MFAGVGQARARGVHAELLIVHQLSIARGAANELPQFIERDVVRFAELLGEFNDTCECVCVCVCVGVCGCGSVSVCESECVSVCMCV